MVSMDSAEVLDKYGDLVCDKNGGYSEFEERIMYMTQKCEFNYEQRPSWPVMIQRRPSD